MAATVTGLAGADAICAARATAGGLTGTFRAFLGSSGSTAWSRISASRGWARLDGRPFGDTAADLQAGRTFYPLILTESVAEIPAGQTLVVTGANGGAGVATCADWTSTSGGSFDVTWGDPRSGYLTYAQNGGTSCNTAMRLYCFETARSVRLRPPVPASARRAFMSATNVGGNITLAGADAACQTEANAVGLPGTYRALLAGNGTTAASRFSIIPSSAPWYRVDNVQLAATAANYLAAGMTPWAALSQRADGVTQEQEIVWSGALNPATAGNAGGTCAGWTAPVGTESVVTYSNRLAADWFGPFTSGDCSETNRLFCLQQ